MIVSLLRFYVQIAELILMDFGTEVDGTLATVIITFAGKVSSPFNKSEATCDT